MRLFSRNRSWQVLATSRCAIFRRQPGPHGLIDETSETFPVQYGTLNSGAAGMADSLKQRLMPLVSKLHESLCRHLTGHDLRTVLGDELFRLRGSGTGRSVVMLALLADVLHVCEIVTGANPRKFPGTLSYTASMWRSAVNAFAKKGLPTFAPFQDLAPQQIPEFLEAYRESSEAFTGGSRHTEWCGLALCRNVAMTCGDRKVVADYERLFLSLLDGLQEQDVSADPQQAMALEQLRDLVSDHCSEITGNVRQQQVDQQAEIADQHERFAAWEARLTQWEADLQGQREALDIERADAATERQRILDERAALNAEQHLQETDGGLTDHAAGGTSSDVTEAERRELWEEREELAIERERLRVWHDDLNALRKQLDQDLADLGVFEADNLSDGATEELSGEAAEGDPPAEKA